MSTPDQVAAQIRFQLDQLSAKNGHHEFEHLCRHLARATITENILPATGPVSAGGDSGRDFESFRTFLQQAQPSTTGFIGSNDEHRMAFICTLEKGLPPKIKSDLKKIHDSGFLGKHVYCFATQDLPVAKRNKLTLFAKNTYNISLEILDGQAISESLATQKTYWIAVRFLNLPSEVILDATPDTPEWYAATLKKHSNNTSEIPLSYESFVELKQAIRFATFNSNQRSDIVVWRKLLERFLLPDEPAELQRRAKYEIAVAAIRGLGAANDCRDLIQLHMQEALIDGSLSAIQDAEVLLSYCSSGVIHGAIDLTNEALENWENLLRERIDQLLAGICSENERCILLQSRGVLCLRISRGGNAREQMREAIKWWSQMIPHLSSAPLFPLEQFSALLTGFAAWIDDYDSYSRLARRIDSALAQRKGKSAAAERCFERAVAFNSAGRLRFALLELHRAKVDWFCAETLHASARAMLLISYTYLELRLPLAAKYYALAVAQIAFTSKDDDVREQLTDALTQVATIEYLQGAWFAYCSLLRVVVTSHALSRNSPFDLEQHPEITECIARAAAIQALATRLGDPAGHTIAELIRSAAIDPVVSKATLTLESGWSKLNMNSIGEQFQDHLLGAPFNDCGAHRTVSWAALGVVWSARFENKYDLTGAAEELLATLQIILADFSEYELFLLPTRVDMHIEVAPVAEATIDPDESAEVGNSWKIILPADTTATNINATTRHAFTVAARLLGETTLLPANEFVELLQRSAADGIQSKVFVASRYRDLYSSSVDEEAFSEHERHEIDGHLAEFGISPKPADELRWKADPIIEVRGGGTPAELVEQRYIRLPKLLNRTLARLRNEPDFHNTLLELRERKWLDWHILAALFNVTHNYRLQRSSDSLDVSSTDKAIRRTALALNETEPDDIEPIPLSLLTSVENLNFNRRMNMAAILAGMHLRLPIGRQDFNAIEYFLDARFGYWSLDVNHDDPFLIGA